MTADKAQALVEKLVRVGADGSGATDHERANAALRACTLIAEHDLVIVERKVEKERRRRARTPRAQDVVNIVVSAVAEAVRRPSPFMSAVAAHDSACGVESCAGPIYYGERVWRRIKDGEVEYVHADCWHD